MQSCALQPLTLGPKTDVTKRYIDWAISNGFQVIDVNIPRIVAVDDVRLFRAGLENMLTLVRSTSVLSRPMILQFEHSKRVSLQDIYGTTTSSKLLNIL